MNDFLTINANVSIAFGLALLVFLVTLYVLHTLRNSKKR